MPTSLHIPTALLSAVDRRAKALRISRNRFVLSAIERALDQQSNGWPPGFFEQLRQTDCAASG